MKPHPRIRKTIKWGGAAVTVLLVVVWVASGWWRGWIYANRSEFAVACGYFYWQHYEHSNGTITDVHGRRVEMRGVNVVGWELERLRESPDWYWWFASRTDVDWLRVWVPLWLPTLSCLLIMGVAWRFDALARRRAGLNRCPKCNYDRAGIAKDAKCPECGRVAP